MIVVVGGHSRRVGKTAVICGLLRGLPDAGWTAVKLSPHAHAEDEQAGDTARFEAAGARRVLLVSTPEEAAQALSGNTIIESNRALEAVAPDVYLFVVNSAEPFKDSARQYVARADAFVLVGDSEPPLPGRRCFRIDPPAYTSSELISFIWKVRRNPTIP